MLKLFETAVIEGVCVNSFEVIRRCFSKLIRREFEFMPDCSSLNNEGGAASKIDF
jgi:hypothetical protein